MVPILSPYTSPTVQGNDKRNNPDPSGINQVAQVEKELSLFDYYNNYISFDKTLSMEVGYGSSPDISN